MSLTGKRTNDDIVLLDAEGNGRGPPERTPGRGPPERTPNGRGRGAPIDLDDDDQRDPKDSLPTLASAGLGEKNAPAGGKRKLAKPNEDFDLDYRELLGATDEIMSDVSSDLLNTHVVSKSGTDKMTGNLDFNGNDIKNVGVLSAETVDVENTMTIPDV